MKVRDCMHLGAEWVEPDATIVDIARLMRDKDVGAVPVAENDRLIGMVTDRDIVCRGLTRAEPPAAIRAGDVMSKPILYVYADEEVGDAVRLMERNRIRRLPVIDRNRRFVGMLSLRDLGEKAEPGLIASVMRVIAARPP